MNYFWFYNKYYTMASNKAATGLKNSKNKHFANLLISHTDYVTKKTRIVSKFYGSTYVDVSDIDKVGNRNIIKVKDYSSFLCSNVFQLVYVYRILEGVSRPKLMGEVYHFFSHYINENVLLRYEMGVYDSCSIDRAYSFYLFLVAKHEQKPFFTVTPTFFEFLGGGLVHVSGRLFSEMYKDYVPEKYKK